MYSLLFSALLVGVPLVAGAPVSPQVDSGADIFARALVEGRGSCNADNLLRLLRTPSNLPQALPFCSTYLGVPASTSTVTTVTPVVTALETQTVTETNVLSTTITNTETTVSTATATLVATLTTTVTSVAPVKVRAAKGPLSETVLASYDASRISSACACLTIPIDVVLTTLTAAAVTTTSSATATVETTTTATQTALETTTLQATVTSSTTTVSTAIVAPTATPTAFRLVSTNAAGQKVYYQRTAYALGDLLYQTTDVAQAVTFHLDTQNHLAFTSPAYPTPVIAYYGSTFFDGGNNAVVVPFLPQPLGSGNTAYTWSYDPASGALTQTAVAGLVFQTCSRPFDGAAQQLLFVQPGAVYTAGGCVGVSFTAEAA